MENIDKLAEQLSGMQDAMISLQKDRNVDDKSVIHRQGKIIMVLSILIASISVAFIVFLNLSNMEHQRVMLDSTKQHEENLKEVMQENDRRFMEFMSQYDFETTTIEQSMDNTQGDITDSGNINMPPK